MKKNIIFLGTLLLSSAAYSQVGINNETPKATLDVTAKTTDGTKPEGIIAPRLTGDQIKSGDTQYATPQIGTIVYATAAVGTSTPKTVNITSPGYYYFDNNLVWQKFGSGTAAVGTEPWYIQNTSTQATTNSQNIYQQGKVAIGFTDADGVSTKQLEVVGDFKANYANGGIHNGINTNYPGLGQPVNIMYVANNADLMSATNSSLVLVTPGTTNIQSTNASTGGGTVGAYSTATGGNVGMYASNVAGNTSSSIWGYNTNSTQNYVELANKRSGAEETVVQVEKLSGVNFNFKNTTGGIQGNYTFPRNNGTANQVLTTNGTASAQLAWQDVSDLVQNNDWHITGNAGTTPIATVPTAMATTNNYVGTTDAQNLVLGVNGISRGIFTQQGSFIGGAGTMDLGALPAHAFGATLPTGSFIWGGGHQLAVSAGNANYAAVFGNRNSVSSSNGFTTGTQNVIGTSSVGSMVSGTENNLGNNFPNSIVTGRQNVMNYSGTSSVAPNGNIIGGRSNNLSGTSGPVGIIVGGFNNSSTTTSHHFLMTGEANSVNANNALVAGIGNTVSTTMTNAAVVGKYNTPVDNSLFTVGNGTATASQSNAMVVFTNGSVAINASSIPSFSSNSATINPKLHVAGDVASTGAFYTNASKYADYVFEDYFDGSSKINADYDFKSLAETAAYIKANKHLPGVTAIKDILKTKDGYTVNLSELSIQQLEKIEELYLHTIEQQEEISKQKTEISDLKSRMEKLEKLLLKENNNK